MRDSVRNAGEAVSRALNGLRPVFTDNVNLSFLMTDPKNPKCYMLISNEDPDVLIAAIKAARTPARKEEGL